MSDERAKSSEEAAQPAQGSQGIAPAEIAATEGTEGPKDDRFAFDIPPDLADRLRASGKEWQTKAEAALALWLDEASLALRKEGLPGLSRVLREKAEESREKARRGDLERDVERFVSNVVGTIGRDIMGSMFSAAMAGFGGRRRSGQDGPAPAADERRADPADEKQASADPAEKTPR